MPDEIDDLLDEVAGAESGDERGAQAEPAPSAPVIEPLPDEVVVPVVPAERSGEPLPEQVVAPGDPELPPDVVEAAGQHLEVVTQRLSGDQVEYAAGVLSRSGQDAAHLANPGCVLEGVKKAGQVLHAEDLDRVAVALGTLLGRDEAERRGHDPAQTQARVHRAVRWQLWRLGRKLPDEPLLPGVVSADGTHGPDLKAALRQKAKKSGWD